MTAEIHTLYRQTWSAEKALEQYCRYRGLDVDDIPFDEQQAVMYAATWAVKCAIEDALANMQRSRA